MRSATSTRDTRILELIRAAIRRTGYPPTIYELRDNLGVSSHTIVTRSLARLRRSGLIREIGPAWARNAWPVDLPTYSELLREREREAVAS